MNKRRRYKAKAKRRLARLRRERPFAVISIVLDATAREFFADVGY